MDLSLLDFVFAGLAALAAGGINALAGGGTLITFPVLTFLGIPAVAANVTNTVALCPGYFGGTLAQMKDLQGQKNRLWIIQCHGVKYLTSQLFTRLRTHLQHSAQNRTWSLHNGLRIQPYL